MSNALLAQHGMGWEVGGGTVVAVVCGSLPDHPLYFPNTLLFCAGAGISGAGVHKLPPCYNSALIRKQPSLGDLEAIPGRADWAQGKRHGLWSVLGKVINVRNEGGTLRKMAVSGRQEGFQLGLQLGGMGKGCLSRSWNPPTTTHTYTSTHRDIYSG